MNHKPTAGNCYQDCLIILLDGQYDSEQDGECVLCHGYPKLTRDDGDVPRGTKYGHAWLERQAKVTEFAGTALVGFDVVCIDVFTEMVVPKHLFYLAGEIDDAEVSRYDRVRAEQLWDETGFAGPWAPEPDDAHFRDDP